MTSLGRILRTAGRALVIVGLAIFYVAILLVAAGRAPEALLKTGAIIAAIGCYWLIATLIWPPGEKGGVTWEAILGFSCLPAGMISAFAASGDEVGLQASWLVITVFLLPGAIGLIAQAARVKQGAVD
jgi:hypothetical protein